VNKNKESITVLDFNNLSPKQLKCFYELSIGLRNKSYSFISIFVMLILLFIVALFKTILLINFKFLLAFFKGLINGFKYNIKYE